MNTKHLLAAGLLIGGLSVAGCKSGSSPDPTTKSPDGTSMHTGKPPTTVPATGPSAAAPALTDKDMTHVLTVDQPYATTKGGPVAGTLAKGTKVLLFATGTPAEVKTVDGKTAFTSIDGIESIAPPAPPKVRPMAASPAPAAPVTPTTVPSTPPATKPVEDPKIPKAGDLLHVINKDQPFYTSPAGPAAGTLTKGTKVLLMQAGPMAKVKLADGAEVYTVFEGVDLAKK